MAKTSKKGITPSDSVSMVSVGRTYYPPESMWFSDKPPVAS
jgi:hypothetical protein